MRSKEIDIQNAAKYNEGLHSDNAHHRNRKHFFAMLPSAIDSHHVDELIEEMLQPTWIERIKMLPNTLRGWAWHVKNIIISK